MIDCFEEYRILQTLMRAMGAGVRPSRLEILVRTACARRRASGLVLGLLVIVFLCRSAAGSGPINPIAPAVRSEPVARWDFRKANRLTPGAAAAPDTRSGAAAPAAQPAGATPDEANAEHPTSATTLGWQAEHNCRLALAPGRLEVLCTGEDPYFVCPLELPGGQMVLRIRAAGRGLVGPGSIYWRTSTSPQMGEDKVAPLRIEPDGQWREVEVRFRAGGTLQALRIDAGADIAGQQGELLVEWIELEREVACPLRVEYVETVRMADSEGANGGKAAGRFHLRNIGPQPLRFHVADGPITLAPDEQRAVDVPVAGRRALEAARLELSVPGYGPLQQTVFVFHPEAEETWIERPGQGFHLCAAADGSLLRIERGGQLLAILGPLVLVDQQAPPLRLDTDAEAPAGEPARLVFRRADGQAGGRVELRIAGPTLEVAIDWAGPCEGPVVRVFGPLEQGLLAGVEYLGRGERSSSTIDIETPEHLRFAPDPMHLTLPLMAFATPQGMVAMSWDDRDLQPTFATPNFFDGAADHRLSLRCEGKPGKIRASLLIGQEPLEEAILWAIQRSGGLPPVPPRPRSKEAQRQLCLQALAGPLRTAAGWGHCVEERWPRRPFADMASTWWRLSGEVPQLEQLVPGGAHISNPAIYFVTGRAQEWLASEQQATKDIIARQQPDGSFRYDGPMREGHFENTASGLCARPAAELLEFAWITGDREALAAGLHALEFIKRFRTPRGAQIWEIPLHTPDILASAWCVWAYVRGYELTGRKDLLAEARRWAFRGVPFVYLWGRYPVMVYATIPVLGATHRRAPNWIGLPVQWCGLNYAYALTKLAPYDRSLDWDQLAQGILVCAQQMQYADGPHAGLLPDSFVLKTQQRRPWNINPCALVSVELALEGKPDGLAVAGAAGWRIAAPFPVSIEGDQAVITAPQGTTYQVLINGRRIVELQSSGSDTIALGRAP